MTGYLDCQEVIPLTQCALSTPCHASPKVAQGYYLRVLTIRLSPASWPVTRHAVDCLTSALQWHESEGPVAGDDLGDAEQVFASFQSGAAE